MSYTIEARPDERGMLIYVVVQHGIDLTSRWTRADAEYELQRLQVSESQPVKVRLTVVVE